MISRPFPDLSESAFVSNSVLCALSLRVRTYVLCA